MWGLIDPLAKPSNLYTEQGAMLLVETRLREKLYINLTLPIIHLFALTKG